jgi:activator of HSP90 ATPase
MKWSRERIESLLVGADLNVPLTEGRAEIVELTKFEGDSSVSTRKGGKKFGCFDLSFTLKWSGSSGSNAGGEEDEDEVVKGEIKVKEFCSTNDEDEYEYTVSASDGKSESKELLKSRIEKSVESVLLPKLRQFCAELKEL